MLKALTWATAALAATAVHAAEPTTYQQPSAEIRAVLDAPALPGHALSPDQRTLASIATRRYRNVADLARPVLRLAGLRIDAAASSPQLTVSIEALSLRELTKPDAAERVVKLPAGGGFSALRWSPDSRHFLLNRRTANATELWVGDVATAQVRQVKGVKLNTLLETSVAWVSADEIIALTVPDKRGPAPQFDAPSGPVIQESMGRNSPERTLQDLLQNSQDAALFSHHASSALRRIKLSTGASREIGTPGLYSKLEVVGTQGALITERLVPPFSYQVTWRDFAAQVELRDFNGRLLRDLGTIKLKEGVPVEGVITGPRNFWASPQANGAVYWVEALDGGDQRNKVPFRDRLMRLDAPYQGEAREVHRTAGRLSSLNFVDAGDRAIVAEFDRDRLWISADLIALDGAAKPQRLQDRSLRDRYADPGQPLMRVLPNGRGIVRVDGGDRLLLAGAGASKDGELPFIDSYSLQDGKATRLFRSGATHYERPITLLADGGLLTSRESATEPPNLMLRSGAGFEQLQALTRHTDPAPQLRAVKRELVKFKRADGVELSFWLYLPPDYQAGERRPTLVWAYPLEFTDASTAGQVSGSGSRFVQLAGTSPVMMALDGYVVLMDATMPVVGNPKTVNDSFVEQITANAKAIIDKAAELGVSDPQQMVVGGHSYGAFMTANLLAHTDLFKAGIARSGAYNRTLTPFGFQSERRTYWEAQDVYLRLSPFNYADKLKEPILLMHGESDDNPGTFPLQSARLYQALAGTGGQVRYVVLPHESHGYSARESIGHTLFEMSAWMKRQTRDPRAPK
ncbi:prolyl oligopeptidase family serine peptidase [Roseateles asaccharophilus]|uniref:Dipeptidyl aminopeptidase/acylaminoacyl peptidase n=1 Tax=Roseateles asaccharophilus TaxID=582607 RepID=A0ABU2A7S5_9BURK|nr:prolyl oligopeptidase family serine peptidase [Roseateles asaccharophilus]MDR7333251.1 dipeptidyl aminopeptidase/acylaminoacyl peptidase [Roseateles asaccharophilus]